MRRNVRQWVLGCAVGGLIACGGGASEPEGEATSGEENAAYAGPIGSEDAAGGKEVFSTYCDDCHPDGEEDVGPSLIAEAHTAEQVRKQVREGSGRMRAFGEDRISADDLEKLLAFLASINAVH